MKENATEAEFRRRRRQRSHYGGLSASMQADPRAHISTELSVMQQKYEVRGSNQQGDRWTFTTSDRKQAEEMLAQMREYFDDVGLVES